jgi:oligopeptidase B
MSASPPSAPRRPHAIAAHGHERIDDWFWLRSDDRTDPEVLALLEAENAFVAASLAHTEPLQDELFREMKARIRETDLSVPFRKDGRWFYSRTEEGQQYPILCRTAVEPPPEVPEGDSLDGEEVLLDLNELAGDSDYFALGAYEVSPGQVRLLYSTDHDGSEHYAMRVRDVATGVDLADVIPDTTYGSAWAGDDTLFYVKPDPTMRPHQVWRHHVGEPVEDDVLVYEDPDERFYVSLSLSLTEQWVHITSSSKVTSEEHLIPAHEPGRPPRVVQPREQGVEYDVTHAPTPDEDRFVVLTNADDAVNFTLRTAPAATPGRDHWRTLVAHRDDVKLEGVTPFAGHLVRYERREGVRRVVVTRYADGHEYELAMPEEVYDTGPATNAEFDSPNLRFVYTSLVTPTTVFDEVLDSGARTLLKTTEVVGGHDPADYETGRLWATAPDGERVPISYVHRAEVPHDGSAPCLLYGYGSYEACLDPTFSTLRLSLLDRGFVFAVAHVRGGGELGRPWYDDGKELRKTNSFTDFIASAEHLIAAQITTADRLVARGASAGGLLMGAVTNRRPDLFAAVVAEVPFVDCLTTILDDTLPLTVTEWEEWGNPVADPEVYEYLRRYSPYDNVAPRPYPTILATAGLNDPRVSYWEPAKWVQKLRATTTSGRPIYLKTEMGAGHQGPSGRYDAWKDEAFVFAFLLDALGRAG